MSETLVDRGFLGTGLKSVGTSRCVLNVVRTLIEGDKRVFIKDYQRIGVKQKDPNIIALPPILEVQSFIPHKSRLNFNVRCLADTMVLKDGIPVSAKIWRTYNIIFNAKLHTKELLATLGETDFKVLQEAGVINENEKYNVNKRYIISLEGLPLTSASWAQPHVFNLPGLFQEEKELMAEQKEVNKYIWGKSSKDNNEVYKDKSQEAQGEIEEHEVNCVEYRLASPYKAQKYDYSEKSEQECIARVQEIRKRLKSIHFLMRAIVFSCEIRDSKAIKWGSAEIKYGKPTQLGKCRGIQLKRVAWTEQTTRSV